MDAFREFLESSTIHGLGYISSSKSHVTKVLWACVVITGFSTAGFLINNSYTDWKDNPVSTTISTQPIADLKFPKITVCPPRGSNTALNYDLMKLNKTMNDTTRQRLYEANSQVFVTEVKKAKAKNLVASLNKDTISNMYHGYESITRSYHHSVEEAPDDNYPEIRTQFRNISSPKFGDMLALSLIHI